MEGVESSQETETNEREEEQQSEEDRRDEESSWVDREKRKRTLKLTRRFKIFMMVKVFVGRVLEFAIPLAFLVKPNTVSKFS
jgi:hypothetical protein